MERKSLHISLEKGIYYKSTLSCLYEVAEFKIYRVLNIILFGEFWTYMASLDVAKADQNMVQKNLRAISSILNNTISELMLI
jgi:hypothetical protein